MFGLIETIDAGSHSSVIFFMASSRQRHRTKEGILDNISTLTKLGNNLFVVLKKLVL
jgi:hypothetical protein